jgi:adenine-specific DNA methylase
MSDSRRLIEAAFPLKQASLDSVHEKNVRHGHISTLHIWPARRPLAACRAALIATLLPDPGTPEERKALVERIGGKVVKRIEKKKLGGKMIEVERKETVGGILHWGRESSPDLEWFRQEIRKAYGGRAPKVLDPFAGGGAIPLEAMRLGCEVTAADINPVAWFLLKCTLEYPQKLAGQLRPLPDFVLGDHDFMEAFFKAQGLKGAALRTQLERLGLERKGDERPLNLDYPHELLEADLAWHVRAWGWWVLQKAKKELAPYYPVIDGKPTVAYLWARTVHCKNCRATIPLLKTLWLCKKDKKRVLLTMEPKTDKTGVVFGIQADVPVVGGNAAQRREHDKRIGAGTMSGSGAACPLCSGIMTKSDIAVEGLAGRLGVEMTAVVFAGEGGKDYRLPRAEEHRSSADSATAIDRVFETVPFGVCAEPVPRGGGGASRAFSIDGFGLTEWRMVFTQRQELCLGTFVGCMRDAREDGRMKSPFPDWREAVAAFLAASLSRLADRNSQLCTWQSNAEKIGHTFTRFALPITWDFVELMPWADSSGGFLQAIEWVAQVVEHAAAATRSSPPALVTRQSATREARPGLDVVLTDPPYYDAIPYAGLMDFFYVWLRRTLHGLSPEFDENFKHPLAPKWDEAAGDGELIDDSSRHGGDADKSKRTYEDGMARAFQACRTVLKPDGRLVIVFAHKHPDAWETLVAAIIRAGFVVDGSWPIQTERTARTRSLSSAALSSSVWLVCRRRPEDAMPGWDNKVLADMQARIGERLREFWDAGISGPDFVWAATGPALEAYSKHPVVKKANEPGRLLEVSEFLKHVRRLVVDFVVGRVLSSGGSSEAAGSLDDVTTYYLLHRNDFKMADAPAGASILYAVSCGLSDSALADQYDILVRTGGQAAEEDDEEETPAGESEADVEEGTGSKVRLKEWFQRRRPSMGYEAASGRPIPLIDQIHRLMHLWKTGDVTKVDDYLESRGLRRNALFLQVLQSLIELAAAGVEERSLLESISNHLGIRGAAPEEKQPILLSVDEKPPGEDA